MTKSLEERVVKTLEDGRLIVECGFCGGTGAFPSTATHDTIGDDLGVCTVCGGKGISTFKCVIDDLMLCRYCGGTGRGFDEGYFFGKTCDVCKGRGVVLVVSGRSRSDESIWRLLHPFVVKVAKSRMETEHYADAVEAAFKEYNDVVKHIVKQATGRELDGAELMRQAFSVKNPVIKLSTIHTDSEKAIQQGYMEISAGAMIGIRNPKAHGNITISKNRALHMLFVCSLLFQNIDKYIAEHNQRS